MLLRPVHHCQGRRYDDDPTPRFEPRFRAKRERWGIDLGVNFSLDVNDSTTKVLVFPVLDFHYFIVKDMLRVYVGAKGGVQRNGLRSVSQLNPFFDTDQNLSNSWERLNIYGGFKGSITRSIGRTCLVPLFRSFFKLP